MATANHGTPVWELSKENAAPLQRGRNVAVLERSLADTDETRAVKEQAVDRFERLVHPSEEKDYQVAESSSSGDDPLIHWLGYIKFHQESFPTNTHGQFLLMERCFRALSRFRRYANDVRFIRLCCQYAEKTERPNEIFQYLYQQKIGCETAIFWIAWGFVAEKRQEWAFANDVYSKGIRKRAKPLEKLNKRYREFQRRMARQWLNATQTQDDDENPTTNRGILGSLSEEAVHRNDRSTSRPPGPSFLGQNPQRDTLQTRQNTFIDRSVASRPANNSNENSAANAFPIFVEDGGSSGNLLDDSFVQGEVPYRQLEREQDRKKENTHGPERWNDRGGYAPTYKKPAKASRPRMTNPPPFAVFVDEECAEQHRKEESRQARDFDAHRRVRDERTFRERDDLCVGDALFKDPLRYVRDPSQLAIDQATQNQTSSTMQPDPKRKANAGFSTRLLRHPDTGEEQCFEEARAIAGYYKLVPQSTNQYNLVTPDQSDNMPMEDESSEEDDVSMTDESSGPVVAERPFGQRRRSLSIPQNKSLSIPQNKSVELQTPRNASTASSTVDDLAAGTMERADPTINTQLALKELSMMFSSPAIGLNDSVSGVMERSGGLGPILNESGVSEPAEDRSMVVIDEDRALEETSFENFEGQQRGNKRAAFSIYSESDQVEQPMAKPRAFGFEVFDETERTKRIATHSGEATKPSCVGSDVNGKNQKSSGTFGIYDASEETAKNLKQSTTEGNFPPNPEIHSKFAANSDATETNGNGQKNDTNVAASGFTVYQDDGDTATLSMFDQTMNCDEATSDSLDPYVSK